MKLAVFEQILPLIQVYEMCESYYRVRMIQQAPLLQFLHLNHLHHDQIGVISALERGLLLVQSLIDP